jgi:hypothetical protein
MPEATRQQLLRRALTLMGRDLLAESLKVPPQLLDAWVSGHATMPDRKFLLLADVLSKYESP